MAVVERITRTIFTPARNLLIKHQVVFGKKDRDTQQRKGELMKYDFKSEKYSNASTLSSLFLETSDFIFLEKISYDKEIENEKIYISYPHLFKVKRGLKDALRWFYDDEYENLFIHKNGNILFNSDYETERILISGLIGQKSLTLIPDVIVIDEVEYEGLLVYFNTDDDLVRMTIDQLEAMYDFFITFNLYQSSQLLINYVSQINPENLNFNASYGRGRGYHSKELTLRKKERIKEKEDKDE